MFYWEHEKSQTNGHVTSVRVRCGDKTKGGRFLPGHDAKLKKSLVDAALGGSKRAANRLEALRWTKFLAAKSRLKRSNNFAD